CVFARRVPGGFGILVSGQVRIVSLTKGGFPLPHRPQRFGVARALALAARGHSDEITRYGLCLPAADRQHDISVGLYSEGSGTEHGLPTDRNRRLHAVVNRTRRSTKHVTERID